MTMLDGARATWMRFSPRERWLVGLGASIVAAALGYAFVWEPLTRGLVETRHATFEAAQRVTTARTLASEIAGIAREDRAPRTVDLRAAADRVLNAAGVRGDVTAIAVADNRVRVTFAAVDFTALAALIDRFGREEQLFVIEALLAARVVPGSVRAELSLARPPAQ